MNTVSSKSTHWFRLTKPDYTGKVSVYGVSSWDMPDGPRLRREMRRTTQLESPAAIRRWAKKYREVSEADTLDAIAHLGHNQQSATKN